MERQGLVIGVAIFFLATATGFIGTQHFQAPEQPEKFRSLMNTTVNGDQNVQEVSFDGQSLDLMYEDSEEAKMYIDLDQDGSFDLELENLTRNGEVRETTQVVTFEDRSYTLYFRYMDDPNESGEGYLRLYQVRQL